MSTGLNPLDAAPGYMLILEYRVMGATRGTKNGCKAKKRNKKPKRLKIGTKNNIKYKKDSGFDFQIKWIKPEF